MPLIIVIGLLVILFFSVVVHECCHGLAALHNGDDTARLMGRLTLNPLPHIDLMGTIILPLILVLLSQLSGAGLFIIGWAKPVPINPYLFRNPRKGMIEVGASGPLANIILGLIFALLFRISQMSARSGAGLLLLYGVFINFLLALFNLIPIPPLDGSRIIGGLLPPQAQTAYYRVEPYGIIIIFTLLFFGLLNPLLIVINKAVLLVTGAGII